MAYGKAIELFLVDGDANGLVTAELSNWNGKAIKIPRTDVKDCTRHDITEAGVYFLFCQEDDGSDSVAKQAGYDLFMELRFFAGGSHEGAVVRGGCW